MEILTGVVLPKEISKKKQQQKQNNIKQKQTKTNVYIIYTKIVRALWLAEGRVFAWEYVNMVVWRKDFCVSRRIWILSGIHSRLSNLFYFWRFPKNRPVNGAEIPAKFAFTTDTSIPAGERTLTTSVVPAPWLRLEWYHQMVRKTKRRKSLHKIFVVHMRHIGQNKI